MRVNFHRNTNNVLCISNPSTPLRLPFTPTNNETNSLEHGHPPKRLWAILECMLQILHDSFLSDSLFYPPLRLNIVRVGIE